MAKKSVAGFKVREGMPVGIRVTLRGENMYNFLDRLVSIALPRVKDFRGVPRNGFDGRGNYNFGLQEQLIFPEISYDSIMQIRGCGPCHHGFPHRFREQFAGGGGEETQSETKDISDAGKHR